MHDNVRFGLVCHGFNETGKKSLYSQLWSKPPIPILPLLATKNKTKKAIKAFKYFIFLHEKNRFQDYDFRFSEKTKIFT